MSDLLEFIRVVGLPGALALYVAFRLDQAEARRAIDAQNTNRHLRGIGSSLAKLGAPYDTDPPPVAPEPTEPTLPLVRRRRRPVQVKTPPPGVPIFRSDDDVTDGK